jgi:hypothetical protein
MVQQLVADLLALGEKAPGQGHQTEAVVQALFDVFETRGAARLAAWLELTGEWRRLTHVREAVRSVVAKRVSFGDVNAAQAEDMVLVSVVMAMGAGLFGRSLAQLIGKPPGRTRKVAAEALRAYVATHREG